MPLLCGRLLALAELETNSLRPNMQEEVHTTPQAIKLICYGRFALLYSSLLSFRSLLFEMKRMMVAITFQSKNSKNTSS